MLESHRLIGKFANIEWQNFTEKRKKALAPYRKLYEGYEKALEITKVDVVLKSNSEFLMVLLEPNEDYLNRVHFSGKDELMKQGKVWLIHSMWAVRENKREKTNYSEVKVLDYESLKDSIKYDEDLETNVSIAEPSVTKVDEVSLEENSTAGGYESQEPQPGVMEKTSQVILRGTGESKGIIEIVPDELQSAEENSIVTEDSTIMSDNTQLTVLGFNKGGLSLGIDNQVLQEFFNADGLDAFTTLEESLEGSSPEELLTKANAFNTVQEGLYLLQGGLYAYIKENKLYKKFTDETGLPYTAWEAFVVEHPDLFSDLGRQAVDNRINVYNFCKDNELSFKRLQDDKIPMYRIMEVINLTKNNPEVNVEEYVYSDKSVADIKKEVKRPEPAQPLPNTEESKEVQWKTIKMVFIENDYEEFIQTINLLNGFLEPEQQIKVDDDTIIDRESIKRLKPTAIGAFIHNLLMYLTVQQSEEGKAIGLLPEDYADLLEHKFPGYKFKVQEI